MPPLAIFRGFGGYRQESTSDIDDSAKRGNAPTPRGSDNISRNRKDESTSDDSDLRKRMAEMSDSQIKMEVEYLNIITSLNKEKEEARNEIQKRMKESSSLSESNRSLVSKVSELENKVEQMKKEKVIHDGRRAPTQESRPTSLPTGDPRLLALETPPSAKKRQQELEKIKESLRIRNESNNVLNSKVQRIRDKYAERRMEADDMSDTGSVMSITSTQSCISMVRSNPRQHMVEVKKLEMKYERQMAINRRLEKSLVIAQKAKAGIEQQLKELQKEMVELQESHKKEIEDLNFQRAEGIFAGACTDGADMQDSNDANDIISELNEQIKDKDDQIQTLKSTIQTFSETERRLEELIVQSIEQQNTHNVEVAELRSDLITKTKKLEHLKNVELDFRKIRNEFELSKNEIILKDATLLKVKEENIRISKKCDAMELDFAFTQQKNTQTWQELEELREKYELEVQRSTRLQDELLDMEASNLMGPSASDADASQLELLKNIARQLQNELDEKDTKIQDLSLEMETHTLAQDEFEIIQKDLTNVSDKLRQKEEECNQLSNEKFQISLRLESTKVDVMALQQENAKTLRELQDLKEKYTIEIHEKAGLQQNFEQLSNGQTLPEARDEIECGEV